MTITVMENNSSFLFLNIPVWLGIRPLETFLSLKPIVTESYSVVVNKRLKGQLVLYSFSTKVTYTVSTQK